MGIRRAAILLPALSCFAAATGLAEESIENPGTFQEGQFVSSVAGGVLWSPSPRGERRTFDLALAQLRLGIMLTSPHGETWWRGNWELGGEAFGGAIVTGQGDYLFGGESWLRYNFVPTRSRVTPFVELGFGLAFTDADRRIVGQEFNFISGAGAGICCRLGEHWGLTLEYRVQHISNAGMEDHNHGINAHGAMLGVSRFF